MSIIKTYTQYLYESVSYSSVKSYKKSRSNYFGQDIAKALLNDNKLRWTRDEQAEDEDWSKVYLAVHGDVTFMLVKEDSGAQDHWLMYAFSKNSYANLWNEITAINKHVPKDPHYS